MLRRIVIVCLFVCAAALPLQSQASTDQPWTGEPTLVSGTSRYDAGEWIYTDFVYDDYGADTVPAGQPNVVSLASTTGDFRYPDGTTAAGNAADIVEVRVRIAPGGEDLDVRVTLQSMTSSDVPALLVEADGESAVFTDANSTVDIDANTMTFTVPGAASGDTVSLNIGAGLNDGNGGLRAGQPGFAHTDPGAFTTGAPTDNRLFDLAFNTHALEGRGGAWNENVQSAALASGDMAPFTQTIDLGLLAGAVTTPVPLEAGYSVRLFESRQDLGEGMRASFPQYRGRWQPYAVWVPEGYDPGVPTPLLLSLHSLSVHHNQYRGGPPASASYKTYYEQIEAGLGAVVVTPLGRGPDGWYRNEALVDTMEVWADALKSFNIDPERVLVGGYSMGGYGTYRLTTLMPDSFASAVSIVGPPGNGIWAYPGPPPGGEDSPDFTRPQLENTLHVPFWITQGVADELVPVAGVDQQAQRFAELGHEYRFALHPAADHLSFVFQDEWSREVSWFASHMTRVTDPHRVTLKVRPASWASGGNPTILGHLSSLTSEVGARLTGAYWVDDVVTAEGADVTGDIDLSSGAVAQRQTGTNEIVTVGLDGPSPHLLRGMDKTWTTAPTSDTLSGRLSGVTSLTVDVGRAGLSNSPLTLIATDTPVTITFVRDGAPVSSVQLG